MADAQRPVASEGEPPSGPRGRHVGDPATAPRRATRPATNTPGRVPAHRAGSRTSADAQPVLPRSKDDLDLGWGGADGAGSADAADDERFLRDVPPHWQ